MKQLKHFQPLNIIFQGPTGAVGKSGDEGLRGVQVNNRGHRK